jgi:hypothetical protein
MKMEITSGERKRLTLHDWKSPIGIGLAVSLFPLACIAIISRATGHEQFTQVIGVFIISVLIALPVLDLTL